MKMSKLAGLSAVVVIAGFSLSNRVFAKGSSPSLPPIEEAAGPCNLDPTNASYTPVTTSRGVEWDVAIVHSTHPGGALVHVIAPIGNNPIQISNICLEDGWTVSNYRLDGSWSSTGGFRLNLDYNASRAIDYRQVAGGMRMTEF
jgi:hypothetical protein